MRFELLLVQVLMFCSGTQDLRYVKPNYSPSVICPGQPCLSLGQLAEMADIYIITGSTFVFLAGNHSLQTVLHFTNVSDIILRGFANSSTGSISIFLEKNATISCDNVSNFHIQGISFVLCKYQCKEESALKLLNSGQIMISRSVFLGSRNETLAAVRSIYSKHSNTTVLNCLFEGNTGPYGGAINIHSDSILNITGNMFERNKARESGGAIRAYGGVIISERNIFKQNVCGVRGGAFDCTMCRLLMSGNNTFESNGLLRPSTFGGAVDVFNGKLTIASGYLVFSNNNALHGGGMWISDSEVSCSGAGTVVLDGNKAESGGGMFIIQSSAQMSGCNLKFFRNVAEQSGGGVTMGKIATIHSANTRESVLSGNFTNNRAKCGGAVSIYSEKNFTLKHASITGNSGSALCISDSTVTLQRNRILNNAGSNGGGIYSLDSTLLFEGYNVLAGNTAQSGGAAYLLQGTVLFDGVTIFTRNSVEGDGGALYAVGTVINLQQMTNFSFNRAKNGGAVYLEGGAYMTVESYTHFNSSFNTALGYGGGIFHVDYPAPIQCGYDDNLQYPQELHCVIRFVGKQTLYNIVYRGTKITKISISSYCDSAGIDGSFLFGGLLDRCQVHYFPLLSAKEETSTMYQFMIDRGILDVITVNDNETQVTQQAITSKPYALCFCDGPDHGRECAGSRSREIHRGQKFTVRLLAVAQGNSVISTSVTAITSPTASLKLLQNPQHLPRNCSSLTYNLYSTMENEELTLYPESPCRDTGFSRVVLSLILLPCPDGFMLVFDGQCVCEERLHKYNVSCNINEDFYLTKKAGSEFWMGADYINETYEGLILYTTCPVEYCKTDEVNMTLRDPDVQCAQGRIGVLCGGCAENYSLLIGSSKCDKCSNTYLALVLPFAAAGIALVAFLSILRLTVATGMLNSLILYGNIVQVNRRLFFPANAVNVLTVFIAWLNLDLGFETCFYYGMDAFAQTCLQFAFPVYVWVLIGLIIFTSRYSIIVSKLIGHNPVAVLATLLLLSYTKVLKIITEVYSSVKLDYPRNETVTVWLKDANVPYLQSKHLTVTVVTSLVLVFLFLPYTILLLLGWKLYRFSGLTYFYWLNRLKPLLDSYYASYKIHTRYWTGLLLLVRCALYIVFSFNSLGNERNSLLSIIIAFTAIGFAVGFVYRGRIYKKSVLNILEASVYFNLVTLSAVTLAQVAHITALTYFLVGIVFTTTLGVIAYHFHDVYMAKSAVWVEITAMTARQFKNRKTTAETAPSNVNIATSSHDPHKNVSKTFIALREPLLEDN